MFKGFALFVIWRTWQFEGLNCISHIRGIHVIPPGSCGRLPNLNPISRTQGRQDGKKWQEMVRRNAINMNTRLTIEIKASLKMKYVLKRRSVTSLFSELLQFVIPFCMMNTCYKSKKECKYWESIQSSTTPDPGYQWENDNVTTRHHKREPRGQPFPSRWPQGTTNRMHESITKQDRNNLIDPQKKHRLGTVSKIILLYGLNWFNGAPTSPLVSDVDQDT